MYLSCNYCKRKKYWGWVICMKHHWFVGNRQGDWPCTQLTDDVQEFFINYLLKNKQRTDIVDVECFEEGVCVKLRDPWMPM